MNKFLSLLACAALCAPVAAQKMGSTNTNAPTISQSIAAGEAKMSLNYTAITWADGKTMTMIMDKEKGERARTRVNNNAKGTPLASFSTSVDCKVGDLAVKAGEYQVFFTINAELAWEINFAQGETVQTMKLPLTDSQDESKRLVLAFYAMDNGAGIYVAFGKKMGEIPVSVAAPEKK